MKPEHNHDPIVLDDILHAIAVRTHDGLPANGHYVTIYWTALLGPGAIVTWQRLVTNATDHPEGTTITYATDALATSLGMSRSSLARCINRLAGFGLAHFTNTPGLIFIDATAPTLSRRGLARISLTHPALAARHAQPQHGLDHHDDPAIIHPRPRNHLPAIAHTDPRTTRAIDGIEAISYDSEPVR